MMWRTPFGISSNSVPPSVSRTAQKSAVHVIRRCASCGLRALGGRWYEKFVPIADRLFERHLHELKKEGSI